MARLVISGCGSWFIFKKSHRLVNETYACQRYRFGCTSYGVMVVWICRPNEPVIIHSNQGSQYCSGDWQKFCQKHNLIPSMSCRGNCWDNAVAESFFSSLKKERIKKRIYKTREMARANVFDYIEMFYNRIRRHSHLDGMSPEAFEAASKWGCLMSRILGAVHKPSLCKKLQDYASILLRIIF